MFAGDGSALSTAPRNDSDVRAGLQRHTQRRDLAASIVLLALPDEFRHVLSQHDCRGDSSRRLAQTVIGIAFGPREASYFHYPRVVLTCPLTRASLLCNFR